MGEEEAEKRASGEALPYPNAKDDVHAMLGSQLRTTLTDGRVVEGKFQCMDRLTNFILADAVETGKAAGKGGDKEGDAPGRLAESGVQQRHLGLVMIPGKHLVSVQRLGNGPPIDA